MTSSGRRFASSFYEAIYALVWFPMGLVILLSPFFGLFTLLLWINGSGGSLDNTCNPRTVQAKILAAVAPKTFWHEQVAHLQTEIEAKFFPPSEAMREATAKLQEITRQSKAQIAVPEARTESALIHQYAESLREKAKAIEREAFLREFDRNALNEYNESLGRAQTCLQHSKSHLRRVG